MTNHEKDVLIATDLPIALYLNQRLTFDLLAVLQGGLSQFVTVETATSGEKSTRISGEAQLGVSNVFAFLGLRLSGQGSRQAEETQSESTTQEIVHTPASLFAQLRSDLSKRNLVRYVEGSSHLNEVHPGEFVEFEATLRRNPLTEMLDSFSQLVPLVRMASIGTTQTEIQGSRQSGRKSGRGQGKQDELSVVRSQIDLLRSAVTAEGSQDLIAEVGTMKVVLTTEQDFFIDPSMNDTIDGTFRVFGKATRVVSDQNDKISLLRRTALGKFGNMADSLAGVFESLQDAGFSGSVETEIRGPTMQIMPIAIFS